MCALRRQLVLDRRPLLILPKQLKERMLRTRQHHCTCLALTLMLLLLPLLNPTEFQFGIVQMLPRRRTLETRKAELEAVLGWIGPGWGSWVRAGGGGRGGLCAGGEH